MASSSLRPSHALFRHVAHSPLALCSRAASTSASASTSCSSSAAAAAATVSRKGKEPARLVATTAARSFSTLRQLRKPSQSSAETATPATPSPYDGVSPASWMGKQKRQRQHAASATWTGQSGGSMSREHVFSPDLGASSTQPQQQMPFENVAESSKAAQQRGSATATASSSSATPTASVDPAAPPSKPSPPSPPEAASEACATLSPSSPAAPRSQTPTKSTSSTRTSASVPAEGSAAQPSSAPAPAPKAKPASGERVFRARKQALSLTPSAVERLRDLLESSSGPRLIRIGVRNKGCAGMSYHLEYVAPDQAGKFDERVRQDGVEVLIDSKALFSIIGSEMDWKEDKLSAKFVFNNPNVKESCGCGESFLT